ncbi:hypothetical protein [Rathayibacter tanaceti]|uniref:Uncharacterized protein n=2 Tax=Rathayibacter tanaceti TaxID=1671680 RepID=A0A162IZH3_9MICO|nr:hypothetical protein [Rathayibacter tanaceti]KZX20037.1 hypothetical protein ACH61_02849 [Rathayibacter tanaceti]QHC56765.1 hypothetical protein GSU10_14770 [Rathayibacter tanaceti]TCO33737.1 hypothetical protein EV639_11420 [Rathayibacter tanaceti]
MVFQQNPGDLLGHTPRRRPVRGPKRDRWMWWRLGSGAAATAAGLIALLVFTAPR